MNRKYLSKTALWWAISIYDPFQREAHITASVVTLQIDLMLSVGF